MTIDLHGISQGAFNLIVTEEDSDQAYYTRHYTHFDWPEGASGPTIGIGYDCGYVTSAELRQDWTGIVSDETISALLPAVGRTGQSAHQFVVAHKGDVTITWDQALAEFANREIPKWVGRVAHELPNTDKLPPDCLGGIVSLAYNRGASFTMPGPRFAEMRAIRQHMMDLAFDQIPGEFLSMRRLWPQGGDLWRRREHEAALFASGLGKPAATPPLPLSNNVAWVQTALNKISNAGLTVDGVTGPATRGAIAAYQASHGLTPDKIVGPLTRAAMEHDLTGA